MLDRLTAAERRGATVLVLILLLGALHDGWRASAMRRATRGAEGGGVGAGAVTDSLAGSGEPTPKPMAAAGDRIDLNRAAVSDLDRLPGIGPVLARRIVEHRERHGPFRRVEELLAVRGIGPRLFARVQPRVRVGERAAAAAAAGPPSSLQSAQSQTPHRADSTSVVPAPSR